MELKKRLSALFFALVMLLSVSVSAFAGYLEEPPLIYDAATDSYSIAANSTEYIGDLTLNEYLSFRKELQTFSLPTESNDRYFYFSEPVRVGVRVWGDSTTAYPEIQNEVNNTASGLYVGTPDVSITYGYNISNVTWENVNSRGITITKGGYIDAYILADYKMSDVKSLNCSGLLEGTLYTAYANVTVPLRSYKMQLVVNGSPVGDVYTTTNSNGEHTLNIDYELTEDVESIGFRFFYDENWWANQLGISASGAGYDFPVNFYLKDRTEWSFTEQEDPTPGLLGNLIDWVIGIYNSVFVPDSQKDDADNFQSEVSDTVAGADEVKDELDQLEKPNPEDIDTDLSDIITDDAYTQQTQIFADLLRFDKITDMLMIVFTMALISYVLFGKKG